jgi:hypothetical protein
MRKRAGLDHPRRARVGAIAAAPNPPAPGARQSWASPASRGSTPNWTWRIAGAAGIAIAAYLLRYQIADGARGVLHLLGLAGASVPAAPAQGAGAPRDHVDASAFAPMSARAGEDFLVQIFLHAPDDATTLAMLAQEADREADRAADAGTGRLGVVTLEIAVERGRRIDVALEADSLVIDAPSQSLIWRGDPRACQLTVTAPVGALGRSHQLRARVSVGGVPLGSLRFVVKVTSGATAPLDITGEEPSVGV